MTTPRHESLTVDGWVYSVLGIGGGRVLLRVEPWGGEPREHEVALAVVQRVWSGETAACRLGAPGRARRR